MTAIVPTIYNKIADTILTPIISNVRNSNIEIIPTVIKKYFNASIIYFYMFNLKQQNICHCLNLNNTTYH